ncbi:hypothetical protein [Carboxylicivirga marina]|uniref:Auto-transporter adhesin head GIN domain-containing protein n=1 Tax=Carboxylicivirga marina TaxID=2800988 RepID=A0ABS1HH83_9BACT|nr:hypothetical protein [Carboxylicivirga marina]MBK3516559.1 hypothetical protein [Carboxylicivirga marina]
MKTSKIILIAFLSVICLGLLSFLITINNKKYKGNSIQSKTKTEKLPDFSIVKVINGASVRIQSSNTNKVKYSYSADSLNNPIFHIKGDTLIVEPSQLDKHNIECTFETNNITEIINKGGTITLDLTQDSIKICNQNNGRCFLNRKSSVKNIQLKSIEKSSTTISADNIYQLIMDVNNSNVIVNKDIQSITLSANNNSRVTLQSVKSLVVECDTTSKFNVY